MSAQARAEEQQRLTARLKGLSVEDPTYNLVFKLLVRAHELERAEAEAEVARMSPATLWERLALGKALIRQLFAADDVRAMQVLAALCGIAPADLADQVRADVTSRTTER